MYKQHKVKGLKTDTFLQSHLQTSLPLEKVDDRMTSGAIQAYVPAALIFVVRCHSRAKPKSVTFRVLLLRSSFSTRSRIRTVKMTDECCNRCEKMTLHCDIKITRYDQK